MCARAFRVVELAKCSCIEMIYVPVVYPFFIRCAKYKQTKLYTILAPCFVVVVVVMASITKQGTFPAKCLIASVCACVCVNSGWRTIYKPNLCIVSNGIGANPYSVFLSVIVLLAKPAVVAPTPITTTAPPTQLIHSSAAQPSLTEVANYPHTPHITHSHQLEQVNQLRSSQIPTQSSVWWTFDSQHSEYRMQYQLFKLLSFEKMGKTFFVCQMDFFLSAIIVWRHGHLDDWFAFESGKLRSSG